MNMATLKSIPSTLLLLVLTFVFVMPTTPAWSMVQDSGDERPTWWSRQPDDKDDDAKDDAETSDDVDDDDEEEDADEDEDAYLAIVNARVHTVSEGTLEGATILCKNGVIDQIGWSVSIPDEAEVIDVDGYEVYPGLVAVRSTGILGGGVPQDSSDVYSLNMTLALAAGITTAVTGNTAAKLTYGTLDDMALKDRLFENLAYSTRNPAARRKVREGFERVRDHMREVRNYEREKQRNPDAEKPDDSWIKGDFAKYQRLLKKEATAMVDANQAHDLIQICDLATYFDFPLAIRGAYEGWTVPTHLARANALVMMTPRTVVASNDRLNRPNGATIENAKILSDHGIPLAFIPTGSLFGPGYQISLGGLAGRDLQHLAMSAAFAVRGGLDPDMAVRGVTLDAARVLGVDDRIGSIEVGKDADFAIVDGDLLHYMTQVRYTIVNGKIAYDKAEESLFSHIRPREDVPAEPAQDFWPRRLGADW